jgi:hypothetical protein
MAAGWGRIQSSSFVRVEWEGKIENQPVRWQLLVVCDLVGGQNRPNKSWTKILAETLAPLLLGIDIYFNLRVAVWVICTNV